MLCRGVQFCSGTTTGCIERVASRHDTENNVQWWWHRGGCLIIIVVVVPSCHLCIYIHYVCDILSHSHSHTHPFFIFGTDQITYCESLAMKTEISMMDDLPLECRNLERVQQLLQQKKDRPKVDPFAGMSGAHKVKGNYVKGQETHHQIQRRLTTGATIGQRRFSKLDK